jgi:alpha-tubulin suppressor-like RCC1 family protein
MGRQRNASRESSIGGAAGSSRLPLLRALLCVAALAVAALSPAVAQAEETGSEAVAWGRNLRSQLGAGFQTGDSGEESPVAVLGLSNIIEMASGEGNAEHGFAFARLSNGTVEGWGHDEFGILGTGAGESKTEKCTGEAKVEEEGKEVKEGEVEEVENAVKVTVPGLSEVKQIAASGTSAAALLTNGKVMTWGNNQEGEHGNGHGGLVCETQEVDGLVAEVKGLSGVEQISSGDGAVLALVESGGTTEVKAWGRNVENNLGLEESKNLKKEREQEHEDEKEKEKRKEEEKEGAKLGPPVEYPERFCNTPVGNVQCSKVPRTVVGLKTEKVEKELAAEGSPHIVQIAAGKNSYAALYSNGTVRPWGGSSMSLGGAEKEFNKVPGLGEGESFGKVVAISLGLSADKQQTLALLADGKVVGWGSNEDGQLGSGSEVCKTGTGEHKCIKTPREISGLENITAVSAGYASTYALSSSGTVYALGGNQYKQLGTGSVAEKSETATAVSGIGAVGNIAAGERSVYAVLGSGVKAPSPAFVVTPKKTVSEFGTIYSLTATYAFANAFKKGFKVCVYDASEECALRHLSTSEEEAKSFTQSLLAPATVYTVKIDDGGTGRSIKAETLP